VLIKEQLNYSLGFVLLAPLEDPEEEGLKELFLSYSYHLIKVQDIAVDHRSIVLTVSAPSDLKPKSIARALKEFACAKFKANLFEQGCAIQTKPPISSSSALTDYFNELSGFSLNGIKASEEQSAVIEKGLSGQSFKVDARAGSGKTFTTEMLFKYMPRKTRILYIVLNERNAKEAMDRFGGFCDICTFHAWVKNNYLSYNSVLNAKFKLKQGQGPGYDQIAQILSFSSIQNINHGFLYKAVMKVLNAFMFSDSKEIDLDFVSDNANGYDSISSDLLCRLDNKLLKEIVSNPEVPLQHDMYMKLFQLSESEMPYDLIAIDEAQDQNPCALSIIERQKAQKIYIGDSNQGINGFRGAVNVFKILSAYDTLYLTESYRFGTQLAEPANRVLGMLGLEQRELIKAKGGAACSFDINKPYAYIARTNASCFSYAIRAAEEEGKRICFLGANRDFFSPVYDFYYLLNGNKEKIKDPQLKKFDWDQYSKFMEEAGDSDNYKYYKFVDQHRNQSLAKLNSIMAKSVELINADVIILTGHKSKGLEFDQVLVASDFKIDGENLKDEDLMLLYVALTRARRSLKVEGSLRVKLEY